MGYQWHFEILWTYRFALLRGAEITFWVTLFSLAIGLALGLVFGLLRSSRNAFLRCQVWTTAGIAGQRER